jgi:hypothetical protein
LGLKPRKKREHVFGVFSRLVVLPCGLFTPANRSSEALLWSLDVAPTGLVNVLEVVNGGED